MYLHARWSRERSVRISLMAGAWAVWNAVSTCPPIAQGADTTVTWMATTGRRKLDRPHQLYRANQYSLIYRARLAGTSYQVVIPTSTSVFGPFTVVLGTSENVDGITLGKRTPLPLVVLPKGETNWRYCLPAGISIF